MDCFYTLGMSRVRQNMIQSQDAALFQVASKSPVFSYENISPAGPADVAASVLRTEPAVHPKTWRYVHANPIAFERGNKGHPMLTRKSNDPMARHAVGLPVYWRDSS